MYEGGGGGKKKKTSIFLAFVGDPAQGKKEGKKRVSGSPPEGKLIGHPVDEKRGENSSIARFKRNTR